MEEPEKDKAKVTINSKKSMSPIKDGVRQYEEKTLSKYKVADKKSNLKSHTGFSQ